MEEERSEVNVRQIFMTDLKRGEEREGMGRELLSETRDD